mgnify:CR=1 FL=1
MEQNNKLIAEFMSWDSPTTIPINLHLSNLELDNGEVMELKFHTSWDWLMPVVQKIEQDCEGVPQEMINISLYSNMKEVYNAVVKFIKDTQHEWR